MNHPPVQLDARFDEVCTAQVSDIIEQIRRHNMDNLALRPPIPRQVRSIVDGLLAIEPVETIAANAGLSVENLLDVCSKHGTFVAHSLGKPGVDAENPLFASEVDQLPLYQSCLPPVGKKGQYKVAKVAKPNRKSPIPANRYILDDSWKPVLKQRHIKASLAGIVSAAPGEVDIVRMIARKYRERSPFTYDHVMNFMSLVRRGRINEVGDVADDPVFNMGMVASWDMLEAARVDVMCALRTFIDLDTELDNPAATLHSLGLLWQAEARKMQRLADQGSQAAKDALTRERRFWHQRVEAAPDNYMFGDIAQFNNAQVKLIAEAGGLDVDQGERQIVRIVRQGLEERDARGDDDLLIPLGVTAYRAGAMPAFWKAVKRYLDGDSNWRAELDRAVEKAYSNS